MSGVSLILQSRDHPVTGAVAEQNDLSLWKRTRTDRFDRSDRVLNCLQRRIVGLWLNDTMQTSNQCRMSPFVFSYRAKDEHRTASNAVHATASWQLS